MYIFQLLICYRRSIIMCHKSLKLVCSKQSYCNNNQDILFWPPCIVYLQIATIRQFYIIVTWIAMHFLIQRLKFKTKINISRARKRFKGLSPTSILLTEWMSHTLVETSLPDKQMQKSTLYTRLYIIIIVHVVTLTSKTTTRSTAVAEIADRTDS